MAALKVPSIDLCMSCAMDRDQVQKPMLTARYRRIFEHACLDLHARLQAMPLCECGHFSIGTEQSFDPPQNSHHQPVPLIRDRATTSNGSAGPHVVQYSRPAKKLVTWAPMKEVRRYHERRSVTNHQRPSGGAGSDNDEKISKLPKKKWWDNCVHRFLKMFKRPLYTMTRETAVNEEVIDEQAQ